MKLTKKTVGKEDVFFEDGVKKYTHYKNSDGFEYWSDENPKNPKNMVVEVDIEPFKFKKEK